MKTIIGFETDDIIENLFESQLQKYQKGLEESMKGSEFLFDGVDLLYYKCNKVSLNRGGSYIDSPKQLKNKKATINIFQYAGTVVLKHEQIKSHPERISVIKSFIYQYNWKETDFPSHKKDWKSLNQMINQLLLISYMYFTILKK